MAALSYQRHQTMTVIPGMNAVAFTDDSSEYGAPYVIAAQFPIQIFKQPSFPSGASWFETARYASSP
jgi:hypothetical protein